MFYGTSFNTDSSKMVISLEKLIGVIFECNYYNCLTNFQRIQALFQIKTKAPNQNIDEQY